MTKIGHDLGASVVLLFFVAAIQNGRAITYQVNWHIKGFSGAKFFAASVRGFEWSKFQPRTCSGCKVINGLSEDFGTWT